MTNGENTALLRREQPSDLHNEYGAIETAEENPNSIEVEFQLKNL